MAVIRRLYVLNANGEEVEIKTPQQLQKLIASLSPEEYQKWKDTYRFTPITNRTGVKAYTGTSWDM